MSEAMEVALRIQLESILLQTPASCPDPQRGDSAWDCECGLGSNQPDTARIDQVMAAFVSVLIAEADRLDIAAAESPAIFQRRLLRNGATALDNLAWAISVNLSPLTDLPLIPVVTDGDDDRH